MDRPTQQAQPSQKARALYLRRRSLQSDRAACLFDERVYLPIRPVVELTTERIRRLEMLARLLFENREEAQA